MSRLIDADALIEGRVGNDPVVIAAKCAPTVDAVDVVRCVACRYSTPHPHYKGWIRCGGRLCGRIFYGQFFCPAGEAKQVQEASRQAIEQMEGNRCEDI